jgi:GNAT superfamily N-acetyltransferase
MMLRLLKPAGQDVSYALLDEMRLPDGSPVHVSLLLSCSKEELCEGFRRLSKISRYQRFHTSLRKLTDSQLTYLTDIDSLNRAVVVAHADEGPERQGGVGLARYARIEGEPGTAEFAVTVLDGCQGMGIGTELLKHLRRVAHDRGIRTLRGHVLRGNLRMMRLLDGLGARKRDSHDGTCRYDLPTDGGRITAFS